MNEIVFPLAPDMSSPAVADLQDALRELLERAALLPDDPQARAQLAERLRLERLDKVYRVATRILVELFQKERALDASGKVDQATADAINRLLRDVGLLQPEPFARPRVSIVSGTVVRQDDLPLQDLQVCAFHHEDEMAIRLGEDRTDADGRYTIRYEALPDVPSLRLRVSAVGSDGRTLYSSDTIDHPKAVEIVHLRLPTLEQEPASRRIEGQVILKHGVPAEGVELRLYRRDFGGAVTRLGTTVTLADGFYALQHDQRSEVSLEVRVVDATGAETVISKPLHAASSDAARSVVNLVAPSELRPPRAEYRRLVEDLKPHVGELSQLKGAREDEGRQDLTVLNRATGWDARVIALAALSERLSADADVALPQEAIYGMLRAGLPSDKLMLAQVEPGVVASALKKAADAKVVELTDQEITQLAQRFSAFSSKVRLGVQAPGSSATYGELLKASGLDDKGRERFAPVFLEHRGDAADLWVKAKQAGLDPEQIDKLQLQGKLAFLAGNSVPMTARLMQMQIVDPVQLVERDLHRADRWKEEARAAVGSDPAALEALIPVAYVGDDVEERLDAYAEDMSRKVRLSYPTQVVSRLVEQDEADAFKLGATRATTAKLLRDAANQGFRLGETPVEQFLATRVGPLESISEAEAKTARMQARTLQRVYQVTPTNESMPVLLSLGIRSAYDLMGYAENVFARLYDAKHLELYPGKPAPRGEAQLVYRKAQQVSSVTYNVFAIAKKLENEPHIRGMSAPVEVRESVRNELVKQFPTMEALFGSMDFCACEHCQSVLSPAAYLVDLLQFVDAEPEVWSNFVARWKLDHDGQDYSTRYRAPYDVLLERRPDLPHIALTCENTHTAMPYIDVVNEILEYFVANGKLDAEAAHDTTGVTSNELLAEPQNVIRKAYESLLETRYPLGLPFDLWLETVRLFCEHFDTPLARVLEVLRPSDALFAPKQPFDRHAVFTEALGLTPADAAILTATEPLATWHELYGFASADQARTPMTDDTGQRIDLNSAKALSRRLAVTYEELVEIVETAFVNPRSAALGSLHKLGIGIHALRAYRDAANRAFYDANQDLLGRERTSLPPADQLRFDDLSAQDWERLAETRAVELRLQSFADRSGVSQARLQEDLAAVPLDEILILADPSAGCDFDLTILQYASLRPADPIDFLRINLFVRLWRKLGWSIEETDRALQAFVPRSQPYEAAHLAAKPLETAIVYLSHLKELDAKLRVGKHSRLRLTTLWTDLPITGTRPLYAELFLTRSVLKTDDVFDEPLGRYLSPEAVAAQARAHTFVVRRSVPPSDAIDAAVFGGTSVEARYDPLAEVQHLAFTGVMSDAEKAVLGALSPSPALPGLLDALQQQGKEFSLVKSHLLALQAALGVSASDVGAILADSGSSLDTAELSLAQVSVLHRYVLLAKALKLSLAELITLRQLSGLEPFKALHPDPLTSIEQDHPFLHTMRFVEVARVVDESGLKIEDLDFLLRHRFDATSKHRGNDESLRTLLRTLGEGVRAIRAEHAVPDDPGSISDEALRQKLGLALPAEVVDELLAMLDGSVEFTATRDGVAPADRLWPEGFAGEAGVREVPYNEARQVQKLTFRGVLFDAAKDRLLDRLPRAVPPGPHVPSAVLAGLLEDVRQQAESFFATHLQRQPAAAQPGGGFLEAGDFALLFDPDLPRAPGESEQERTRRRRAALANAFLPFLQQRLIRQLVVQSMVAYTAADPALVESLLTDERLLALPGTLLEAIAATGDRGLSVSFFDSVDGSGARQATRATVASADTTLKDARDGSANPLGAANSAHFEGYLEVPAPGAYRFYVVLEKSGAEAELRFDHLTQPVFWSDSAAADGDVLGDETNRFLELEPGIPYRFALDLRRLNGGRARVLVQGETLAKDDLARLTLTPAHAVSGAARAVVLLTKTILVWQGLGLGDREARYMLTRASRFDDLSLSDLPTEVSQSPDTPDARAAVQRRFAQVLRLAAYARLKRDLAAADDDLIVLFETNETGDMDRVYSQLARLTRRDETTVRTAANVLFSAPTFDSERPLVRVWEVLQIVERFGVPVASLLEWTRVVGSDATPEQRFATARDLKEALKARFDPDAWQSIARPIFDKLRRRQRDALVAHALHQRGFARMEQLYEYFLIDPGMEPVVQTSRIRLAISSLQLFVQRCLLNLEEHVHPSAIINAQQWEWMKRYRVWEANRKIFLFPENWLEPEFRDDKTHIFADLEGALLQGDVSNDMVEDAFLAYLRKLDELARLDVVAMHLEDKADPAQNTLHVIGRTYSQPHKYFHRRYVHQMWTPWEPVTVEIDGDHLAPVAWRDRLYLFWVTFVEKADAPTGARGTDVKLLGADNSKAVGDMTLEQVTGQVLATGSSRSVEAHLHWCEYLNGEWSTPESAGFNAPIVKSGVTSFDRSSVFVHVSVARDGDEEGGVYIHLGGALDGSFFLAGRNSAPEREGYAANGPMGAKPANPYSANGARPTRYAGSGGLTVKFDQVISSEPGKSPKSASPSILESGGPFTLLPCDNNIELAAGGDIASLMKPLFYQDSLHTLFVEPSVTEQTIDEWQDWVVPPPPPEPKHLDPDWWRKLPVNPLDPRRPKWDPGPRIDARINPNPEDDWLLNRGTTLIFDDKLIGARGDVALEIVKRSDVGAVRQGATLVNVNPGSDLSLGSTVAIKDRNELTNVGITELDGGLNIVGPGGFNTAMSKNLAENLTRLSGKLRTSSEF